MNIRVLFNPRAGSAGQIEALRTALSADPRVTLHELAPDEDIGKLAAQAATTHDMVAVAGGDGTVHAAVNGLVAAGAPATLAVLPLGTGNDFCRTMAIPLDPVEAVGLLRSGTARAIDVARLAGDRTGFMINAATGGFSGKVASDVTADLKAFWGPLAYLRGAVGAIAELPRYRVTVRLDGGPPETFDALNLVVANARTAAGGTVVAPTANPEDGLLDLVVVRHSAALDLTVVAARLMHGDYIGDENVVHRTARTVDLEAHPPLPLSVDGELCEGQRFSFEAARGALRVLTGPGYHARPEAEAPLEHDEASESASGGEKGVGRRLFGLLGAALLLVKRTPRGYLAGFAAAFAVLLFVWLARGVAGNKWQDWDARTGAAVRASGAHTELALAVTRLGDAGPYAVLVAVAVAVLLAKRRYVNAAALLAVVAGVLVMEGLIKPLLTVARPDLPIPRHGATGYSFPSGHALRGVGFFGYIGYLCVTGTLHAGLRLSSAAACSVLAAAVCWSRVYLGVHHPTDVLAGALAAVAWVATCLAARSYAKTRSTARRE